MQQEQQQEQQQADEQDEAGAWGESGPEEPSSFNIEDLAGVSQPLGFFDPVGLSSGLSEGRLRFYREVELKHARLAMLAAAGFAVGEQFHPLFGGQVDVPSVIAFQETPLQSFWPPILLAISVVEIFSVFSFQSPWGGDLWSIRPDWEPGDFGWDPLKLEPESPEEFKEMQTKELNNGRLAMVAIVGMISQELATGNKLF
jgi:hypothetical protein